MSLADKPAYPVTIWDKETNKGTPTYGMTLRQYYAGLAMQAIVTSDNAKSLDSIDEVVLLSVKLAEKLIKELEKEK